MRYWVANCDKAHLCVGSTVGPNIFVKFVRGAPLKFQENKTQIYDEFGLIPNKVKLINCCGGGSSSFGFWNEFMNYSKKQIEFVGVEAGGPKKVKHAAPLTFGSKIVFSMERLNMLTKIVMAKLKRQSLLALDWIIRECHLYIAF